MPVQDRLARGANKVKKAISGLRTPKAQTQALPPPKAPRSQASSVSPEKLRKKQRARAKTTLDPKKPKISGLRKLGRFGAGGLALAATDTATAQGGAKGFGEGVAQAVTGISVDPQTGEGTKLSTLDRFTAPFRGAASGIADGFTSEPAPAAPAAPAAPETPAGLRQPVAGQTSPALTPSGAQPNVVPAFQAPAATPGAAPPLPPLPPTQSTAPTFGEKQELRSARIGVGKLRSGFLTPDQVSAQQDAAQSRLDTAQAAPGLRVSAQTAQRGQDANAQASQVRSQAIAARGAGKGTGLAFRDQLALYKQQYAERRDAIGDNAKAVADVNDSIDKDFGDDIQGATFAKALLESSNDPNYDFSTPIGRASRAALKSIAVDETNDDRWIWDRLFGANKLGADKKLDFTFSGWSYDPAADEIISDIGTTVDVGDFSNPDQAAMVKQMIQSDNQGDQQKQGLR